MNAPNLLNVREALRWMRDGSLTKEELLTACLHQIARLNPRLNAFITVCAEGKLHGELRTVPEKKEVPRPAGSQQASERLALQDVPIAAKDLFETANVRTTAGSLFFKEYIPKEDAKVIATLKTAGALIIGKTNTHEIALGVTTANPHFGPCRNPWDETRIPGGSSGGSAVAVSTGMALAGLGTDTGGSIRIPAALCGVVGLKPTSGRVSLRGVLPLSWNLDHAGPITNTVEDAALMLQVMAGYDPEDPYSVDTPVDDYLHGLRGGIKGWRVALATGVYVDETSPEVLEAVQQAAKVLAHAGARIDPIDVSYLREAALANGLITQADGAAYHRERLAEHPEWFGEDVRRRLETGRSLSSTEYILARRTQTEMKHKLAGLLKAYDILVLPSTPITAPPIEGGDAVEQARRLTRFTAPFNLTGLPAISIPYGLSREGLPIGLQMVAAAWNESGLLRATFALERELDWRVRRPPIAVE